MKIRSLLLTVLLAAAAGIAAASGTLGVVRGDGDVRLEERPVAGFSAIEHFGSGTVRFSTGPAHQLTVETDANILPYLRTEVRGGTLRLGTRPGAPGINPTRLVFHVTAPDLQAVSLDGSGDILLESRIDAPRFSISIDGSGDVEGALATESLRVSIQGSGDVRLRGTAASARHTIDGSGSIDARDLASVDVEVGIQGSGNATVSASGALDVVISGSGDVRYTGDPRVTVRSTGSGTVRSL